jgi:putative membrane protein insertion efficiency factor
VVTKLLIAVIRAYQITLSRLILAAFGPVCRFEPSCSRYAVACLEGHGALRGSLLSVRRLCKCHPFHPGGYDPPPPPRSFLHPPPGRAHHAGPSAPSDPPSPVPTGEAPKSPAPPARSGVDTPDFSQTRPETTA